VTLPVAALGAARLTPRAVITIEAKGGGRIVVRAVADEVDKFEGQLPFVWAPNSPSSQSLTHRSAPSQRPAVVELQPEDDDRRPGERRVTT